MTFELEADGVHFWCTSAAVTLKLMEKGARLVDEAQAEHLPQGVEHVASADEPAPDEADRTGR